MRTGANAIPIHTPRGNIPPLDPADIPTSPGDGSPAVARVNAAGRPLPSGEGGFAASSVASAEAAPVADVDGDALTREELEELAALEAWKRQQVKEQRRRLQLLREERVNSSSESADRKRDETMLGLMTGEAASRVTGLVSPPRTPLGVARSSLDDAEVLLPGTPGVTALGAGRSSADYAEGRLPGTPGMNALARRLEDRLAAVATPEPRAEAALPPVIGPPEPTLGVETSQGWQAAFQEMALAVKTMASSLTDSKEASVLKLERKRPVIKMESAESFMNEVVSLENTYAEVGARNFRRRWAIFRPSLEGRARETVEVELERRGLTAEKIAAFAEEDCKALYEYLLAYMELSCGLTVDRKAEISLAAMSKVLMTENTPAAAEKLIADYKHAYLLELRAKLVEDTSIAVTKRLFEFRQKMSADLRGYLKGLPEREQPATLEETYAAIRRRADREGASGQE